LTVRKLAVDSVCASSKRKPSDATTDGK